MRRLVLGIGISFFLTLYTSHSCAPKTYIRGEQFCRDTYSKFKPGKTTEKEFLNLFEKASVHYEVVDGKKVIIRQCGWILFHESRTEYGTSHLYKVVCPVSEFEQGYQYGERTRVLYYVTFLNGVLTSISTS